MPEVPIPLSPPQTAFNPRQTVFYMSWALSLQLSSQTEWDCLLPELTKYLHTNALTAMASRAHPTNLKMRKESNSSTAFPFSWLGFSFISWFLSFRASSNLDKYCSNPCLGGRAAASDGSSPLLRWRSSPVPSLTSWGVLLNKSLSPLRSPTLPAWSAAPDTLETESPSTIRFETEGRGRELDLSCSCWSFDSTWLSSSKEEKQKHRVTHTERSEQRFSLSTGLRFSADVRTARRNPNASAMNRQEKSLRERQLLPRSVRHPAGQGLRSAIFCLYRGRRPRRGRAGPGREPPHHTAPQRSPLPAAGRWKPMMRLIRSSEFISSFLRRSSARRWEAESPAGAPGDAAPTPPPSSIPGRRGRGAAQKGAAPPQRAGAITAHFQWPKPAPPPCVRAKRPGRARHRLLSGGASPSAVPSTKMAAPLSEVT